MREPALVLLRALVWLTPIVVYLRLHDPRPRLVALGVTSRVNRVGLTWGALGAVAYLLLMGSLLALSTSAEERPTLLSLLASVSVVYQVCKVVLEELLLRGFLLGQLSRFTTAFRAQASVAVLFGLLHVPGWIALQGVTVGLIPSTIVLTLLGAVLGGVARASNSILPAIALHLANNLMADWLGGA